MTRVALLTTALTAVYLLVLSSLHPGDVLVGIGIAAAVAVASAGIAPGRRLDPPLARRLAGVPALAAGTAAEIVRGSWHVALYTLSRRRLETPGIVDIPRGERTASGVVAWGFLTALAPDEVVVDVDEARGVLLVHVLDAGRAAAIRRRHHHVYERRQRRVFP